MRQQESQIVVLGKINSVAECNEAHRRICGLLIEDCFAIGKFFLSQKAKCKHGMWTQWVKDNLIFSERTARRYMCVVRNQDILMKEPVLMATGKVEEDVKHTLQEAIELDKTDSVSDLKPDPIRSDPPKPIKTANDAYKKLVKPKKKVAIRQPAADQARDSGKVKEWQPHPDAKREVVDADGPGEIVKITNPDGTERWQFIPPLPKEVELPEEQGLELIAEGVDVWLNGFGEERGGKVAQKILLTIGLWAVEHDRGQAIQTFKDCVRLIDEGKEDEKR